MILGPRTLIVDGKAHKVIAFQEDSNGVQVTTRPLDSPMVVHLHLTHQRWQQIQQPNKHQRPVPILRK